MEEVTLCDEQKKAVDRILSFKERAIVLTGCAGSGKSTVIAHLKAHHRGRFAIAATTGRSAINVGGSTVDRLFCMDRKKWALGQWLPRSMEKCPDRVIIDEASMVGHNMAELLHTAAEEYRKQLILVGDWGQARPVEDDWPTHSKLFTGIEIIRLQECHRQTEKPYLDALNEVRKGELSESTNQLFESCEMPTPGDDHQVRLYATNLAVDEYNQQMLGKHCEESGNPPFNPLASFIDVQGKYKLREDQKEAMFKNARLIYESPLAIGCRVMVLRNGTGFINGNVQREFPIVNGDTGDLVEATAHYSDYKLSSYAKENRDALPGNKVRIKTMQVKLDRAPDLPVTISEYTVPIEDAYGKVEYQLVGFPIALAYAMTIHKSQGMTVDRVWLDMFSIQNMPEEGRHGLCYVALSRTRKLEGLKLNRWTPDLISCDPEIQTFM